MKLINFLTNDMINPTTITIIFMFVAILSVSSIIINIKFYILKIVLAIITCLTTLFLILGLIYKYNTIDSIDTIKNKYNVTLDNNLLTLNLKDDAPLLVKTFYVKEFQYKVSNHKCRVVLENLKSHRTDDFDDEEFKDFVDNNRKD